MKNTQRGATLIVVLVLLLVIMVIGTLAIRSSLMSLNIATNGQAQQLLIQNSDAAIFNVENPNLFVRNLAYDGLFGFIKSDANKGKELVFCYKGTQAQFFNLSEASIMMWVSGNTPSSDSFGTSGYCKLGSSNFFTSGRKAVMTQVAVKVQTSSASTLMGTEDPFSHMQRGTDTESAKIDNAQKLLVISTSIVSALSQVSDSAINDCFSKHMNQVVIPANVTPLTGYEKNVSECLQNLGVPVNTQISEYSLTQTVGRV